MDNKELERMVREQQIKEDEKFITGTIESEYDNYFSSMEEIEEKEWREEKELEIEK